MTSKGLAKKAAQFALTKKALDVVIMDLRKLTTMTDFFVVCSADSTTQVKAIADAVDEGLFQLGENVWHSEGLSEASWALLDCVNVVIHIFHTQTRSFYNLEKLWGDAGFEYVSDTPPKTVIKKTPRKSKKVTQ